MNTVTGVFLQNVDSKSWKIAPCHPRLENVQHSVAAHYMKLERRQVCLVL
jgi:hypothetical protein